MPARVMLPWLVAGGTLLCGTDASSQPRPLFTQHERQSQAAARPNPLCRPEPYETPITYSELTVFDNREVVYQTSTVIPCLGQVGDPPFARRWDAPSGTGSTFRNKLSAPEFEQFKTFLERPDVQGLQSFMNAGPGVGDFKIAIARPAGIQNIEVLSLSPSHFQLVKDPSLIHLICKAKEMARVAARSAELPEWCRNARPLNPAPDTGSVCLLSITDPTPGEKSLYNYSGGNPTPDYSVQFGKGSIMKIPHSPKGTGAGVLVTGLSVADSYLVRIRHQGKPLESFRLRFEEKDRGRRCLFLNELYVTWQDWPADQYPPVCKCKGAKIAPWVTP